MSAYLHAWRDGLWLDFFEGPRWEPGTLVIVDKPGDDKTLTWSYAVRARCSNCSWVGEIRRPKGALCDSVYPCPSCDCSTVRSVHVPE